MNAHFVVSGDVIAKKIEDEYVIVPITSGVGDLDSEIFSLNRTGSMIWDELDGEQTVDEIILALSRRFNIAKDKITGDVIEILSDLLAKGFIVKKK